MGASQTGFLQSFEDLRVKGVYSLTGKAPSRGKLPAVLIIDHRRGMPRWGNESRSM